jgi:hypothetical protein
MTTGPIKKKSSGQRRGHRHRGKRKLAEVVKEMLIAEVTRNHELRRRIAFREAGWGDFLDPDPGAQLKQKVVERIDRMLIERIHSDPRMAETLMDARLAELYGEAYRSPRGTYRPSVGPNDEEVLASEVTRILARRFGRKVIGTAGGRSGRRGGVR